MLRSPKAGPVFVSEQQLVSWCGGSIRAQQQLEERTQIGLEFIAYDCMRVQVGERFQTPLPTYGVSYSREGCETPTMQSAVDWTAHGELQDAEKGRFAALQQFLLNQGLGRWAQVGVCANTLGGACHVSGQYIDRQGGAITADMGTAPAGACFGAAPPEQV